MSRPDLAPPSVALTSVGPSVDGGFVFVAPFSLATPPPADAQYGPLVLDDAGEPVWFLPTEKTAMNLRVQRYRGAPVLTWYEGAVPPEYGGNFVLADSSYREITRVKAGHGYLGDVHEFVITSRGTALIAIYSDVTMDLTSFGGPADGKVVEGIVQELDIKTGRVLFEWHSLEHVPLGESSMTQETPQGNVDYFHLNSIGVDQDGHLIVSARHTSTVYKLNRRTGSIIWRLGGTKSDFVVGPGATFNFQHDARSHADGTLTLFDNGAFAPGAAGAVEPSSRAIRLALDTKAMTATLAHAYPVAKPRLTFAMGNVQQLADGGVFVGWGTDGSFSEIGPDGDTRLDARFAPGTATYRAFRQTWLGKPRTKPTLVLTTETDGSRTAHVSWNGATEVAQWQLRGGLTASALRAVGTAARTGFETAIAVPSGSPYVAVAGLDAKGRVLGTSQAVEV